MLSNNSTVETHSYSIITHNDNNSPKKKNKETNKEKEDIFQMDETKHINDIKLDNKNGQQPEHQEKEPNATDTQNTELSSSFVYSVKRKPFVIDPKYIQKYKLKNTCKEKNTEETTSIDTEHTNKTSIYLSKITLGVSFLGIIAVSYYRWFKN